jgi:hypothetical protein
LVTLENRRADLAVEPGVEAKDGGDFEFPAPRAPLLLSPFDAAVTRWPWRITAVVFAPLATGCRYLLAHATLPRLTLGFALALLGS